MISNDFRDRTNEFNAIAECVKRQRAGQDGDSKKGGANSAVTKTGKSQFSIIATSIGRDIHRTSEKIARLTERKKKNMSSVHFSPDHFVILKSLKRHRCLMSRLLRHRYSV